MTMTDFDTDSQTMTDFDTDTSATPTGADGPIGEKMSRVREIIAQLEDGEVSIERAKELREEGKELLAAVEDDLDLGEASVVERE